MNAALSAQLTEQTFRRAQAVYRLRSLSEDYVIDPSDWVNASPSGAPEQSPGETVIDVVEVLEEEMRDKHLGTAD